ncbi:acid phosphatase/Vanadium-dependent haloperoxidase [Xylona heveae TC161]|uniref:Acid phosphatase/Vanadium-dependent haloperoxidase n=1 Tax=Xylona heveae (strain CBS 132557 / TC161) TaxID=1328760 RepID=A0A165FI48_XYLHT|nr:acid phosphatase/Vanadium-dependent haloperoxidase [Xylona heveae TC161]KZF21005.1 acid phosphatase/Vanadium-dependent haloperoxidase [Xylona heveae TC161]
MARSGSTSARHSSELANKPGILGAIARFWQRSYAADYLGIILLLVASALVQFFLEPFHRMFSLDDLAIKFPHAAVERVPVSYLLFVAGALPLIIIIVWVVLFRPGLHKSHVTILGFLISILLTSFLTDVVKNSVGRPRPDLISRCKPEKGTPEHTLVTFEICTETDHHVLHDGWRSFPSGHSSFAFSGLGYLALFFGGQMHVLRPRTDLARVLIALAPLLVATLIAISRCEDYRHDVYDVTIGSLLGMFVAWFSYRRYYPSLQSIQCDQPFPSRSAGIPSASLSKHRDEEERIGSAREFAIEDLEDDGEAVPLTELGRENGRG